MEKWEEVYKGIIPVGKYQASVQNGDEFGLTIKLESNEYCVNIFFGGGASLRMLEEGIVLENIFSGDDAKKYEKDKFYNVIYKIQDSEFNKFIKSISNELFDFLKLKHYVVVTMNYIIEVITQWEPEIEVVENWNGVEE